MPHSSRSSRHLLANVAFLALQEYVDHAAAAGVHDFTRALCGKHLQPLNAIASPPMTFTALSLVQAARKSVMTCALISD